MFGDLYAERRAIEATYEDVATVTRREDRAGADNIARPVEATVYAGMLCALSKGGDSSRQTQAQQNVEYDRKLFVPPDKEIKPGDKVTVYRFGRFMESPSVEVFQAVGAPLLYRTHREIFLKAVTLA